MSERDQLVVPSAARADSKSFEVVRVWIANRGQHVSLRVGVWQDPAAWGIMLVDLVRHVATAYQQEYGLERKEVLQRIREGLDAEWSTLAEGRAQE